MVNYLGEEEEQSFRQEKPAPCYLIETVNDYIAEKDSQFCTNEDISYMLPSVYLMEEMNLDIAWTVLGEKQKITGHADFPGMAEFSYTYCLDDSEKVIRNHEFCQIRNPFRR